MIEVVFSYYEKKTEGSGYDNEHQLSFTKKLGKQFEEVPDSQLANFIMCQLARRDIWITDVEIYEYVKKKVSFRETKGGIVIRNKKFILEHGGVQEIEEEVIEQPKPPAINKAIPIRWEIFDPDPGYLAMNKGLQLTSGRKYPIFEENTTVFKVNLQGVVHEQPGYEYVIIDDSGKRIKMPAVHFCPVQQHLIGGEQIKQAEAERAAAPKLMYQQKIDPNMPVLR